MMTPLRLIILIGLIAGVTAPVDAQIRSGRGIRVRAPGVDVRVAPLGRQRRAPLRNLARLPPVIVAPIPRVLAPPPPPLIYGRSGYGRVELGRMEYGRPGYGRDVVANERPPLAPVADPVPAVPPPRYVIPPYDEVSRNARRGASPSRDASALAARTSIAAQLEGAARQLRRDLQGHPEEDVWVGYLQPAAVESLASRLAEDDDVSLEEVRGLLENFEGVAANPDLESLSTLPGFVEAQEELRNLAIEKGYQPPAADVFATESTLIDDPEWESDLSGFDSIYQGLDSPERPASTPPPPPVPPKEPGAFEALPLPEPDPVDEPRVIRAEV